jgi:Protein of unknown function (DUF2934)
MAKTKTPRTTKTTTKTETKKLLQMPDSGNGNGYASQYSPADLEAEIRLRAYELYQQRGCEPGQDEQDWLAAEREVLSRRDQDKHTA